MGKIEINNLSGLHDVVAVYRAGLYLDGKREAAEQGEIKIDSEEAEGKIILTLNDT